MPLRGPGPVECSPLPAGNGFGALPLMKSILSGVLTGESSWGTMDGVSTADRMLFIIGDPHISRGNSKDPSPTLATYNWPKRCLLLGEVRAYRRGRRRTMFVGGDTTVSIDLLT